MGTAQRPEPLTRSPRDWVVAAGLVEGPDGLLLVRNRRRNGRHDWSPPGGVVEPGEDVLDGLTREVAEETGLTVTTWRGPVYEVHGEALELGWRLRVEVWWADSYRGRLRVDDPDQIVVDARFFAREACADCLVEAHPWVREPLAEWLADAFTEPRRYRYRIEGADPAQIVVHRVHE